MVEMEQEQEEKEDISEYPWWNNRRRRQRIWRWSQMIIDQPKEEEKTKKNHLSTRAA